jgi:CRP-like cAMP-binding protein
LHARERGAGGQAPTRRAAQHRADAIMLRLRIYPDERDGKAQVEAREKDGEGREGVIMGAKGNIAKERALEAYRELGIVSRACEAAGISRKTWYEWLKEDPDFAQEVADAEEAAIDSLEEAARERAKKSSDLLLMFCLKAKRPEYRDKQQIDITATLQQEIPPAQLADLKAELGRLLLEAHRGGLLTADAIDAECKELPAPAEG